MIRTRSLRVSLMSRSFLGIAPAIALALGVAGGSLLPSSAIAATKAPAFKFTKPFQAVAAPLQTALEAVKTRADVVAAKQTVTEATNAYNQARGAARVQADAARTAALAALGSTLTAEKAQLDSAFTAAGNADDRFMAGNLAVTLGGLAQDEAIQRRGVLAMIESGKADPAQIPQFQFYAGQFSYELKDYAAARTQLQTAISSGFQGNDVGALLAEAYMADNMIPEGLAKLLEAIAYRATTPTPAPVNWYRRGLGAAYKAKLLPQAADFSMALVKAYPTTENWSGAITVVREIGKYPAQETLDLMRLMGRTSSYAEERDYIEYIQAADPRRLPGEAIKVLDAGIAAGKLRPADSFVSDARTIAAGRVAADRASLPGLEREARGSNATGATVIGAADAFLSYDQPAKAEELYTIALAKSGVDLDRTLTRLGISQLDQGKFAEAQANFNKVGGVRKPLAQLWAIYAAQKMAPPSAS
jgi:tetratricopeptide (TPR) repeat protein